MVFPRNGQVAIEYAMVIGFSLLILIPAIIIGLGSADAYRNEIRITHAQEALSAITHAADEVFLEGYPARRTVRVSFPNPITDVIADETLITINMTQQYQLLEWLLVVLPLQVNWFLLTNH